MAGIGLELLYSSVQNQLKSQNDALMCCLHWHMITNGFKVIGVGNSAPADPLSAKASEILPSGWNEDQNVYNLIYKDNKNDISFMKCLKAPDAELLVHVLRSSDNVICNLSLNANDYVTQQFSSFDSAFKNLDKLTKEFNSEVTSKLFASKSDKQKHNQKVKEEVGQSSKPRNDDPLRDRRSEHRTPHPYGGRDDFGMGTNDPFSLGRRDLDPLAAGRGSGGGMVMDPFHGGFPGGPGGFDPSSGLPGARLPRGAVPPGARFDPFGPPDPDAPFGGRRPPRAGPDPDHLPPPGYNDMFM